MNRALNELKNAKTAEEVAAATKKLNVVTQSINETISNNCGYVKRTWKKYVHKQKVKAPTASGFDKTVKEVTKQTEQAAQQAAQKTAQQAAQQAAQQTASTAAKVSSKVVGGLKVAARGAGKFLKNGALIIGFEVLSDKDKLARAYSKDKKTGRRQAVQTGTKAVCATAGYLAGMKAGAAIGTAVGSCIPVIGNAVGFVAGALIGGACAFLGRKLGKWLGGKMVGAPKDKDVADTITEEQVATPSGEYTTNENGAKVAIASQEQLTVVNEVIAWASQVQGTKDNTLTEEELAVLSKLAATMQPAETTQPAQATAQ